MRHSKRRQLSCADINAALAVKNMEPVYGYISGSVSEYKATQANNQTIYFTLDQEYDLEELIKNPLPAVPLEPSFTVHWLAIEGVQPKIVQNPTAQDLLVRPDKQQQVQQPTIQDKDAPKVKEILTKELQVYYEMIVQNMMNPDPRVRSQAIESISTDPGIQGLMPYFVQFISETTPKNLQNLEVTTTMMRFVRALLTNPDIFCEPYLHQLMPVILTCIVTKSLSIPGQDHFSLRRYAAKLNAHICHQYSSVYPTISPRTAKTLVSAFLGDNMPLSSVYGALAGIVELNGTQGVEKIVLPNLKIIEQRMENGRKGNERDEADKLDMLLHETLTKHFEHEVSTQVGANARQTVIDTLKPLYSSYSSILK
ncbi:hypothetical protein EDD86DRAFT_270212 [Gorgonomyces haynaldii]|nr:hypothetical protein EDD86DRAFT_270212 [Gorgonomyces haynaldii]